MLKPNKYTNYKINIFNIAAIIIHILSENGAMKYSHVMKIVQKNIGEDSKYEFQNALNFLFLLGKINYICEQDLLELVAN